MAGRTNVVGNGGGSKGLNGKDVGAVSARFIMPADVDVVRWGLEDDYEVFSALFCKVHCRR